MNLIFSVLQIAEKINDEIKQADITSNFDFEVIKKYNFLLQKVNKSPADCLSHQWSLTLNPDIAKFVIWQPFKEASRNIYTYQSAAKFLENMKKLPKDKYKNSRCRICKSLGHISSLCHFKIPTSAELGLRAREEKILYEFLCSRDFNYTDDNTDHFHSREAFILNAKSWLKREAHFWDNWTDYALQHNIRNPKIVIESCEFSKGRLALGFNHAMGASLHELIMDAFGAILELVDAPPPVSYTHLTLPTNREV